MTDNEPGSRDEPDLSGRVALVTGGGRGIGRSVAMRLARCGAAVIVIARSEDEIGATVRAIRHSGGDASALPADLARISGIRELAAQAAESHGPVDILVNNAATVTPLGPTMDLGLDEVQHAFAINVHAVIALTGAVLPGMLARDWGRIVNVSSGIVDRPGTMVGGNVYAATKGALEAHTLNLAVELEHTGVTVNVYRPGTVDTAMQGYIRGQDPDQVKGGLVERFQRMRADGQLVTPDASARTLVARVTGSETGSVWSFEPDDSAPDDPAPS
ncbi:MAG: SDR family NAD(P)-dependent oxidoreductase [Nocardioidaceae bacterium]